MVGALDPVSVPIPVGSPVIVIESVGLSEAKTDIGFVNLDSTGLPISISESSGA
jgi:hypothetical protein